MSELSDYLLGELDPDEREQFERGLREDSAARAETERLSALVADLAELPAEAWDAAVSSPAAAPSRRSLRERWGLWTARRRALVIVVPATALAVALVLALSGGSGVRSGPSVTLAALPGAPAGSSATATMVGRRHMVLDVSHLRPNSRGDYYELWLMTSPSKLVSVASFRVPGSGRTRLSLRLPAPPGAYRYFDVSLQQAGGGAGISNASVLRAPIPA
jgi:anti-sigma-K factor RskA